MLNRVFIFFLLLCNIFSNAQDKTIDSLKLALKNAKHDTTRCKILNALIESENDDAIWPKYNDQIKSLAEKNLAGLPSESSETKIFKKYLGEAYNNLGTISNWQGDRKNSFLYLNKALKLMQEINDQQGISNSLNFLAFLHSSFGENDKALEFYNRSLELRKKTNDYKGMAEILNSIGLLYKSEGDIINSLNYYQKALQLSEKIDYKDEIASSLNSLARIFNSQGDIVKALEYYQKCLKIQENMEDKEGIALVLNNIGSIYYDQGELSKALENFKSALQLIEETGIKDGKATLLANIGSIYEKQEKDSLALEYYNNSLKIREELGDEEDIASSLNHLGAFYNKRENIQKSLEYYFRSLKIREKISDKEGLSSTYNHIGSVYFKGKDYKKALDYSLKSMKLGKELGFPDKIEDAASILCKIYKATGNHKLALENYELAIKMRDSLNNIQTQKATIKQQTKYEYDKQKALDEKAHQYELKQKEESARTEKNKQMVIISSVSVVLILVVIFSIFLYNRFKLTQKQKAIIELKEKETHIQKEIIEEKHKEITDSINYAERIQRSFLATKELLDENLNEYFVLFKPKDVVSGDFYWASKLNNGDFAFVTADSTGHGVPGAIMSLLNITSLEKAIETEVNPDAILNHTRKTIIERLKKDGSVDGGKDGMDCSLLSLNKEKTKLKIAAAHNPVWIMRQIAGPSTSSGAAVVEPVETTVIEIKADKMPVGKHDKQDVPFTLHEMDLLKGDVIYALSDGFPDQFGGPKGKKFMSKQLRELLQSISSKPMNEQKFILEKTFNEWVGNLEQVDDVCVVGIRV